MRMPASLPAQPGAADVARVMQGLLPGWQVALYRQQAQAVQAVHSLQGGQGPQQALPACAQALGQGGSALLLLQSAPRGGQVQRTYWAWVVGVELQEKRPRANPACRAMALPACRKPGTGMRPYSRALLAVPFGWPMPMSAGYTARVCMQGPGRCHVDGILGQRSESRCLAAITVSPPARPAP